MFSIKTFTKSILVFFTTLFICTGLLFLVCQIPQSAIEKNSRVSAKYFSEREAFPLLRKGQMHTRIDHYADCVLMNVIYHAEDSLAGMIAAPYYRNEGELASDDYLASVMDGKAANAEYSRYWHGSQVLIRPLLTVASIVGIRGILFSLLMGMVAVLIGVLIKKKYWRAVVVYVLSLLCVHMWMTAFSLEYMMVFLVMTAASLIVVVSSRGLSSGDDQWLLNFFIAVGTVTCFLDFLTTETLTFTIPLLFILMLRKEKGLTVSLKEPFCQVLKWGLGWLISYGLTFGIKWILVYTVLGKAAFQNVLSSAMLRVDGMVTADGSAAGELLSSGQRVIMAIVRNLACLFSVGNDGTAGSVLLLAVGVLLVTGAVFYLFRAERLDGCFILMLFLAALLPYGRYLCLSSHSYVHYFFTYRAQMASVMAVLAIVAYQTETGIINRKRRHQRKRR